MHLNCKFYINVLVAGLGGLLLGACVGETSTSTSAFGYEWTPDHMQVGVRWQPFSDRPENNAADALRPVIAEDSSYVQFWVSWPAAEPTEEHTDYTDHMSAYLQAIDTAVDACIAEGLKVEFVFWHTPAWASVSGESGGCKPRRHLYKGFVKRVATHFKGRVHAYQLYHEANGIYHFYDGDMDYLISEIFIKGAKAVRSVYKAKPSEPVIISTAGCSPCEECPALRGLEERGGRGVNEYYDQLIASRKMMKLVDALNLNVSDQNDGYGNMDGHFVSSSWGNYELARGKLDASRYRDKKVMAAESWISWDDSPNAVDVNGDGVCDEQDAYIKTVTIMGQCLERGLNTMNLPWSDNESDWAMGLTKRLDYNGRIKTLKPEILIPANDGGADIVTEKVALHGGDTTFQLADPMGSIFTIDHYINPPDPNHLHYYIWKWYAQIAGGSDEVIRHAIAGEEGNDIVVEGHGFVGAERFRISSYNRSENRFTVLMYAGEARGEGAATLTIPSRIREGLEYNNASSRKDFRGEGFADGEDYIARVVTKDISVEDGRDVDSIETIADVSSVEDGVLTVHIQNMNRFTTVEFVKPREE